VRAGTVPEALIDRAVTRVLRQKVELGLLDPDWSPLPPALREPDPEQPKAVTEIDLDPPAARAIARQLAEESVVLLANDGALPLPATGRIAVVGPMADDIAAMLGCYTFPAHVWRNHVEANGEDSLPVGVEIPTVLDALREELPQARISHAAGCDVDDLSRDGFDAAVALAADADVCVAVVGDRAGLFGRGTSGEGCDSTDLSLPGVQQEFVEALIATGTPVVLVLMTGRPYALGRLADRVSAIVQAFFPGQQGGPAVAGVLSGRVVPTGRLPVSVPRSPGGQPTTYLSPKLGHRSDVSSVDPTPLYPFGYGLSYTTFAWDDLRCGDAPLGEAPVTVPTDGTVTLSLRVTNTGERAGADVVQLYLHDPVAQVNRPVVRLIGYARVPLEPGQSRRVEFQVHADLAAYTGRDGRRLVEPGALELRLSRSCVDVVGTAFVELVGPERFVDHRRHLTTEVTVA